MLPKIISLFLLAVIFTSCDEPKNLDMANSVYDGPMMIVKEVETLYSDSAKLKVKLKAKEQWEYSNGDRIFPQGVHIDFYDETKVPSTTLIANSGKYTKATDSYSVIGNVRIFSNKGETQKLNTEELNWNPKTEKVHTDKFVRIETAKETLTGTGLEASQDFKKYKILKPQGVFANQLP